MLRMVNDQYRRIIYNAQVYANTGAVTYEKAVDMATKKLPVRRYQLHPVFQRRQTYACGLCGYGDPYSQQAGIFAGRRTGNGRNGVSTLL